MIVLTVVTRVYNDPENWNSYFSRKKRKKLLENYENATNPPFSKKLISFGISNLNSLEKNEQTVIC